MGAITQVVGTRTALGSTDSLGNGYYALAGTLNHGTNNPIDVIIEVNVSPGSVSGNKRVVVFAKGSIDGANFASGPESGNVTTDEENLTRVGSVPCNTNGSPRMKLFSLAAAFSGVLPKQTKIIIKNDTGATLGNSGNSVHYAEVTGNVA